jgi:hypothetical protein
MITLRQLSACCLKVEAGDRIGNLRRALDCSMKALAIAQSLNDNYMEADLKGSLGSCAFALGIETGSMNLVHEAISYHMESAASYAQWQNYWQQQAMHYGYAAYCIENLPDGDSIHNAKRRVDLYERMLKCLPADVPESYVVDIAGRLTEARSILE